MVTGLLHMAISMTQGLRCKCQQLTARIHTSVWPLQVAESSQAACEMACKRLLPKLMTAAAAPTPLQPTTDRPADKTQPLALFAILQILKATARLTATGACNQDPLADTASALLQAVSTDQSKSGQAPHTANPSQAIDADSSMDIDTVNAAVSVEDHSLRQLAQGAGHDQGEGQHTTGGVSEEVRLLQLQVMTELVSLPASLQCISPQVGAYQFGFTYLCKVGPSRLLAAV